MYDKAKVLQQAQQLADRLAGLRPGILDSSIMGQSNVGLQQQELRRAGGELVHCINSGWERQAVLDQANKIEGQLQTAAATGLLGDRDLQSYLGLLDDLHASVDQTN